ncbi:HAMP domain-containing sensor histidine kinase [Rugamonas sp.]|uniref:sensor histidine kinase n=1 Tax=Rugamonas sp. TaxID=1926287 RepID=UPI0025D3D88F|nr:HAMP domain-containing sensor histidine kinase [Rugamonas sp.]
MEEILAQWEMFAATVVPPALTMDKVALRNHAKLMLEAIVLDLDNSQTDVAQQLKSYGTGRVLPEESSAETHAQARLFSGFNIEQLVSEYRALRASVLRLWLEDDGVQLTTDAMDVMRFNEAIDQAVAESVGRYAEIVSKSQHLFLAILGHDLRNPLATTLMAARFIMEGTEVDPRYSSAATRIHNAGQRMNSLVNDLLDYTKANLGTGLPVIHKYVNLADLVQSALSEQQMAHPEITFELVASGDCDGQWDDNRLAQVLSNLLSNAVQYGSKDHPVILRISSDEFSVILRIENFGKAIPPEKLNTIFEPLVRIAGHTDTVHGNNLGIGLFIVREIVRAHGGSVKVTSNELTGTAFVVTLPRRPPQHPVHIQFTPR